MLLRIQKRLMAELDGQGRVLATSIRVGRVSRRARNACPSEDAKELAPAELLVFLHCPRVPLSSEGSASTWTFWRVLQQPQVVKAKSRSMDKAGY